MRDDAALSLQRSENELAAAGVLFDVSADRRLQEERFRLEREFTFYSGVISHAYYSIFYAAKALLAAEGVVTAAPDVHRKTLAAFEERLVKTGLLDVALLKIYKAMVVRADELFGIFAREKRKRGTFTYQKLPQANKAPAAESLTNAARFFKTAHALLRE